MNHLHLKSHSIALLALALSAVGCLPKDTRPPPASLLVTASSDAAVQNGFSTDDGWFIEFTKLVVSIGRSSLDGSACNSYSDASYVRVLNMRQPDPQEVNLIYGLGQCDFSFRVAHPVTTSLVGSGVSPEDVLYMQTDSADKYTAQFGLANSGVVAIINGMATSHDQQKTFSWSFRLNELYSTCAVANDAGVDEGLNLIGLASDTLNILVRGETLFQSYADAAQASLLFEPMALADSVYGNNDGSVSLDELSQVPVQIIAAGSTPGAIDAGNAYYFVGGTGIAAPYNLEDLVYLSLFPAMFNYHDTGQCSPSIVTNGRGGL